MSSWEIYHQIKEPRERLLKAYYQSHAYRTTSQKLYTIKTEKLRKKYFLTVAQNSPQLFKQAKTFFSQMTEFANMAHEDSVYSWIVKSDKDKINWQSLFKQKQYQNCIENYAIYNREQRLKELNKQNYQSWDHWYEPHNDLTCRLCTKKLATSFTGSVALAKEFYKLMGFSEIVSKIKFVQDESQTTCALLWFHEGKWQNKVRISETNLGHKVGTINFIKVIVHEIGHVIQGCLIENPTEDNFLPLSSLVEVVAIFFEHLFMTSDFLKQIINDSHSYHHFLKKYQDEQKESLARSLHLLELEFYLYECLNNKSFKANSIARHNHDLLCTYYGFENQKLADHSWQKRLNYFSYYPFKIRNYVVAIVLSHQLFHHYETLLTGPVGQKKNNECLRNLLKICSDKGKDNTPLEYAKTCGLKKNMTSRFMLKAIMEILSTTKRHQHTCSHG
jgi:hypothetical protein